MKQRVTIVLPPSEPDEEVLVNVVVARPGADRARFYYTAINRDGSYNDELTYLGDQAVPHR